MKGSEARMTAFMEGADKRYIIPVYQRKYDWRQENCRQLYEDLKKVIKNGRSSHFFGSIVSSVVPNGSKIEYHIIDGQQRLTTVSLDLLYSHKDEIEEELEISLNWVRADQYKASWISYELKDVSIVDEVDWPRMAKFHAEWSDAICNVVLPYLQSEDALEQRLSEIAGILREWTVSRPEVKENLAKCNRTLTRFTTATLSLENGMDVKTLSTIIGHVSSVTTLNTYTHITDEMRRKAALSIDQGIVKVEVEPIPEQTDEPQKQDFVPAEPPRRRPGTGCVSKLREHLWEGRYSPVWPDGKKHSRNVYAKTREECEEKLKVLILEMKAEIAALRSGASTEYPDGVSSKKKAIAAYLREHPGVSSKSLIARELQMDRSTVQRYYDEIRAEFRGRDAVRKENVNNL